VEIYQKFIAIERGPQFTQVLFPKPPLSAVDLSLISWLEVLRNEQFTTPFQQRSLELKIEELKKPKLDAQWSDQIMAVPVKPVGHFPHAMVPNSRLKFAEKMSRSMIMPKMSASFAMVESTVSNSSRLRKVVSTNPMSQSTAPSVGGFVIASSNAETENLMEQSQIISKMMEKSELTKHSRPTAFDCTSNRETPASIVTNNTSSSSVSLPSQLAQELSQSRRELDSIAQKIQPPNTLSFNSSMRPQLAPVPELSTPGNAVSPTSTPINDIMTHSRLFQEFSNKKQMQRVPLQRHYSDMQRQPIPTPYDYNQQMMRMQISNQPIQIRPYSALPGQVPYYDSAFGVQPMHPSSQIPRPQSYIGPSSFQYQVPQQTASQQVQFVPLCRLEDAQAIRAVAFHPSGKCEFKNQINHL
jgi:hypothetical protein